MSVLVLTRRLLLSATDSALTLLCVAAFVLLLAVGLGKPLGYKLLVDYSDSMQPAIAAGDVLLTRMEPVANAHVGDIITFQDPQQEGKLLTHRVVSRRLGPTAYGFVTRGDANTGVERWSIAADGRVGRYVARLPRAGYVVAEITRGPRRLLLVLVPGLLLAALLVRQIWRL